MDDIDADDNNVSTPASPGMEHLLREQMEANKRFGAPSVLKTRRGPAMFSEPSSADGESSAPKKRGRPNGAKNKSKDPVKRDKPIRKLQA